MNLIHLQGLNCYHDCVINIASYFEADYFAAFASLWSETDFRYDSYRKIYLTKRMIANLGLLGVKVENLTCFLQKDGNTSLSLFNEGEFIIVGIDAFYIPWSQFYRIFHGPHYLIVQNEKKEMLRCIDPTYNKETEQITRQDITSHTFDIIRVSSVAKKPFEIETIHEAQRIADAHPDTRKALLSRIHDCVNGEQEDIILLSKYIDTMIYNRYLYRHFLENKALLFDVDSLFLNGDFFLEWKAVKNGLYKASINRRNNESIINEVVYHFNHLINEEIAAAEKIIYAAGKII